MKCRSRILTVLIAAIATLCLVTTASARTKKYKADIAIVGGGASGVSAGLQAVLLGKKVIILEKQAILGGTGNFAEGVFAAESKIQDRVGIVVTKDETFNYMIEYSHWKANPLLIRAFINKSPETVDWLQKQGVEFEFVAGSGNPEGYITWHVIKGLSKNMIKILSAKYKKLGGTVLLETPVKSLIKKNGKVVGVKAVDADGNRVVVNSKAVIIGTGGYANSKEMLKKYYPEFPDIQPIGNIGKTGDGIRMAWAAGADEEGMGVMHTYRLGIPGYGLRSHLNAAYVQPILFVDKRGKRFMNERLSINWPLAGNAGIRVGGLAYSIFDAALIKEYKTVGIPVPAGGQFMPQWAKLTKFDDEFKKELAKNRGYVFKANSIKELAKKINIKPAILEQTIKENNHYAATHKDPIFNKNPKLLRKIGTPPYYAVKIVPRSLGTIGGVKINEKIEAVNKDGDPIPGLYVVGSDAGGLYGDTYDLMMSGSTLGFAVNSGRMAAENAVKYIGK